MCMAEEIAYRILKRVGFREPKSHPQWDFCVSLAQDEIDKNMQTMQRLAEIAVCSSSQKSCWFKFKEIIKKVFRHGPQDRTRQS